MDQPLHAPLNPPASVPQFSADVSQKRRGRGMTIAIGVVLILIAVFGLLNHLLTISMVLGGSTATLDWVPGFTPDMKREIERMQQEQIAFIMARGSFWAFAAIEMLITLVTFVAGVLLVRSRLSGVAWAKVRAIAVIATLPLWGYESLALIDLSFQQQQRMMEVTLRGQKGASTPQAQEALDKMKPVMRASAYGGLVIGGVFIVVVNGLLLLLVTRPQVREYLEFAQSGGDNDLPIHYDAAMGLPMLPPGLMQGPGGETVHLPPPAQGTAASPQGKS